MPLGFKNILLTLSHCSQGGIPFIILFPIPSPAETVSVGNILLLTFLVYLLRRKSLNRSAHLQEDPWGDTLQRNKRELILLC